MHFAIWWYPFLKKTGLITFGIYKPLGRRPSKHPNSGTLWDARIQQIVKIESPLWLNKALRESRGKSTINF